MTDHDTRDPIVARALQRIPTPDHRVGFWESVHHQLKVEAGHDASFVTHTTLFGPAAADTDGDAINADETIAELRPGSRPGRRRSARLVTAAAAVLVIAVAVGSAVIANRDDPLGVTVEPGSQTTNPTSPPAASAPAEQAALEWFDLLAAGRHASRVGPTGTERPRRVAVL